MPVEDRYWIAGGTKPIPTATSACMNFVNEHSRLLDFVTFTAEAFVSALDKHIDKKPSSPTLALVKSNEEFLHELVLTRTIDNFLCFLADLLALIYKARPEMLRTSEQERIEFILQFSDMDQLRSALAEKRVERLSYLGLRELADHFNKQMSFQLFESSDVLESAAVLVEMRNICVHSRGVVGNISARRFPQFSSQVGKRIDLSYQAIREHRSFIENCVFDIDVRATAKFALPSKALPTPPPSLLPAV